MARIICNAIDTPQVHDEDDFVKANELINSLLDEEAYYESKGYWPELEEAQATRIELEAACERYEGNRFFVAIHRFTAACGPAYSEGF